MKNGSKTIIMLAAENGSLAGGKVGGLADVIRDLPNALAGRGLKLCVITPAYGFLHRENKASFRTKVEFPFGGKKVEGEIWEVTPPAGVKNNVTHLVLEHPSIRGDRIYSQDPPGRPFARDASKFALFCSATGQYMKELPAGSIVHLHDWHTGFFNLLRELHPGFRHLKDNKVVFTIHNMGYQGNRPVKGDDSSVESWFPEIFREGGFPENWNDPRFKEPQFTPLAAGIRFSGRVNTVSPAYAEEILMPSDPRSGFFGGEGLELILAEKKRENRLFGILNGIEYADGSEGPAPSFTELCRLCLDEMVPHQKEDPFIKEASDRIERVKSSRPKVIITSVTRVTEQKVSLLLEPDGSGAAAIDSILRHLKAADGYYFLLGNGPREIEEKFEKTFREHERLIFIKLYSDRIGRALYSGGTLFMMPSSFEPCGISQMIAMRHRQPCIVHATGGLKNTVADGVDGFQFSGATPGERAGALVSATKKAVSLSLGERDAWETMRSNAGLRRFLWSDSARNYAELLYEPD